MADTTIRTYEIRGSFRTDAETAKRIKELIELVVGVFLVPADEETAE